MYAGLTKQMRISAFALSVFLVWLSAAPQTPTLRVHFIDVEGGQATLVVSPSGESMLVDAGFAGFDGRDADRIAAAAKAAGLSQIDYLVVTHYHRDHVGGVPALSQRIPVRVFVDHGPTVETGEQPEALFKAYASVREKGRHLQVRPGDRIPLKGVNVQIVASGGELARKPIHGGAGESNPRCRGAEPQADDPTENARSVGMVMSFGAFRLLDLGDLTWNKERELACPANLLGTVDVYLTTHHGGANSGFPPLVHAVRPRVAVMNNGPKKGGAPEAWQVVRDSPGLQDFWQLHLALDAGADRNAAEQYIANLDETTAHEIRIEAREDGSFTVTNARNGFSRNYGAEEKRH
jgi:competence protein ComEC